MTMPDGLKEKHRNAIIHILAANERVERVVLFGSRAMGTFSTTSDVDLALYGDALTLTDQAHLAAEIDRLPMAQQVDLLLYKSIDNEKLKEHIQRHGKEWFRRGGGVGAEYFETTIGEQLRLQRGFDITKKQQIPGKIPVVSSGGVSSYHNEAKVKGPGVVLGRKGSLGTVFFLNEDYWPHDTSLWVKDFKGNNPRFVYYFFKNISETLKKMDVGAANPALNRNHVHPLPVKWPHQTLQEKIVKILGGIDDIIELNIQINQTLEEMAQAIFKSWFVDFEPVKAKIEAKANGRDPERAAISVISGKTDAELDQLPPEQFAQLRTTAALFPDELIDSELGQIPEGWRWSTIGNEVDVVGGGTPSTKNPDFWEAGDIHWTTPKDLSGNQDKILLSTDRKITEAGLKKISSGLLPVDTVLLSSRAPVGYLALAKVPVAVNQGYIAMKCEKSLPPVYVLQWANFVMDDIKLRASGTTFAEISKTNFRIIPVLVPSDELLSVYSRIVTGFYDKITKFAKESKTLAQLRDTLLPKLLSGEISVNAPESNIQEAI